jgi:serine protease Do
MGAVRASGTLIPAGANGDTRMAAAALPAGTPSKFADLVEHVGNSVVNIKVTKIERTNGPNLMGPDGLGPNSPFGDFFEKFFSDRMPQSHREHRQQGAGSGFIMSFDGKDVGETGSLPAIVAAPPIDKTVQVKVLRNGSEQTLSVKVGRMPGERAETDKTGQAEQPAQGKWGLALRDLDPRTAQRAGLAPEEGVLVADVRPDSPAERAGVRSGDVILEVNRHKVASAAEAQAEAKKHEAGGPLLLLLKRGDASLFAALEQK